MRKLAAMISLAAMTLSAFASKHVTVTQLEQTLSAAGGASVPQKLRSNYPISS